ncbi:MAG: alpha/beta fold hydrolase [Myxococcaceae bacterium]
MLEQAMGTRVTPRTKLVPREADVQTGYELPCDTFIVDGRRSGVESAEVRLFTVPGGCPEHSRTVVCLPGLGASGRSFAPLRAISGEHRFLFWTPPLCTPRGLSPLQFNTRALADAPVLPPQFSLCGSSYGSLVALEFALRNPNRLNALVLVSPVACKDEIRKGAMLAQTAMKVRLPFGYLFAPAVARILGGRNLGSLARAEIVREARRITPGEMGRRLKDILSTELMSELSKLSTPALIIHGDRDRVVPLRSAEKVARAIPGAELVIIKGAGHLPYMSHPDAFNAALDGFLQKAGQQ